MHEAPLPFQPELAAWSLISFFVVVTAVAGLFALSKQAAVRSRLPMTSGFLVAAILLSLMLLGTLSVSTVKTTMVSSPMVSSPVAQQPVDSAPTVALPTSVALESKYPEMTTSAEVSPDSQTKLSLPEWTQRNPIREGERRIVVINGGRFASEEEAELHALDQATVIATQEFRHLDPRGQATRLPIHRDEVQRTAIKQRFLESREHDFGKSKGLMYQVWLQLELSPDLGNRIAAPWRAVAVNARIRLLIGSGIWLTAVMGLLAFAFRWDTAHQGRHRTAVFATVLIVAAGSLLFVA